MAGGLSFVINSLTFLSAGRGNAWAVCRRLFNPPIAAPQASWMVLPALARATALSASMEPSAT